MLNKHLYYGWRIAGTLAITETISWGIVYYAFSVMITPMEAELGWSRSTITGGFSFALFVTTVLTIPVGIWLDRNGARALMTTGSIMGALLLLAWAGVDSVREYYLVWGFIGMVMALVLYEPAFVVIAIWFERQRAAALALVTFAAGFASTIFLPTANWLVNAFGWREAVFILGIVLALTTIPLHALVLRRHPDDLGLRPDGDPIPQNDTSDPAPIGGMSLADAARTQALWALVASFSIVWLAQTAIRIHAIPLLIGRGYSAGFAAWSTGLIGASQVIGRVIFAPLERNFSVRWMTATFFAMQLVSYAVLLVFDSRAAIILFVVLTGASSGALTLASPLLVAQFFGSRQYGRISSVVAIFRRVATTLAPIGAGLLFEFSGSYQPVLGAMILAATIATVIVFAMQHPDGTSSRHPQKDNQTVIH